MFRIVVVVLSLLCLAAPAFAGAPMTDVAPGGCGGCAVEAGGAGIVAVSVAALALVGLLRRR
jgi:hypothetical protein